MTTIWTCTGYNNGDEYPFSMECWIEGEDVAHFLDLDIKENEIRGVHYNQRGERCRNCLRLGRLCSSHDILDNEDPALIARAIAAYRQTTTSGGAAPNPPTPIPSPPSPPKSGRGDFSTKKRKGDDGDAIDRVNQIVAELRSQSQLIKQLTERSEFYEDHYKEAHANYTRTKQMLLATIKQFRKSYSENTTFQEVVRRLETENDNLKKVIDSLQQGLLNTPKEKLSSIETALDESAKLLAHAFFGKEAPHVLDDSHVQAIDIDTFDQHLLAMARQPMSDDDVLAQLEELHLR